jgi:hypothetical protein
LARCLVYIDLNMVRAGVLRHPAHWPVGGYHEVGDRARYRAVGAVEDTFVLREPAASYRATFAGENSRIRPE